MAGADISAGLGESHDASGRLEAIEGGLRDQRRQALTTLEGVRILESLVELFQQGRLTSEDLSNINALITARRKSPDGAPAEVSGSTNLPLTKLSLPPVRSPFEEWRREMKQLDGLAKEHEVLLTSSRFIFSYPCVSVQAAPGSFNVSGSAKLCLSSVPIFDDLQSEDPISELFGKSPLNPETYKPRLDTGAFLAGILVPDYRSADSEELKWGPVELKNGTSIGKLIIPENHSLLAILEYESKKKHYLLASGDSRDYMINGAIPENRIVKSDRIAWSAIKSYLSNAFGKSSEENEKNIEIEKKYTDSPIILRQRSPEPALPSPYKILAQCLDAIAHTHLERKGNIGRLRLPFSGGQTEQQDQRPDVWQISSAIEKFRTDNKLEELFQALANGKTGHSLHEHLSLSTSIWLYRTVELLQQRTENKFKSFFAFAGEMKNLDNTYPVSQHQTWQPFRDFYDEVARIRVDEDYADEDARRNHARVAVEKLAAAINDTL